MKNITFIKKYLLLITMLSVEISCTKNFKAINTDPTGINNLSGDYQYLGLPLQQAQLNIASATTWIYQVEQNLNADVYSGYFMSPSPFNNNSNNLNYAMIPGWNIYAWSNTYQNVMNITQNILEVTQDIQYVAFYQWAKILRVEAMHRVCDKFGPIIYTHYGLPETDGSFTYDAQKDVYHAFLNDLDTAINVFDSLVKNNIPKIFSQYDLVYGGDYSKWLAFANTLRLRLAIRINKVDPAMAKTEGEKSLADMLLADNNNNFIVNIGNNPNPITTIAYSWGDIRIGAPLACYLNGYNDPRTSKYIVDTGGPTPVYIGIRNGINISGSIYANYSKPVSVPNQLQFMVATEAWFLKAEAALNGWAGAGDAKQNYENGITTSFQQYGVGGDAATYINNSTLVPQNYNDARALNGSLQPTAGFNDYTFTNPITIAWSTDPTKQLQQIITQKWLAMYPDGDEAWAEFRRTGFPELMPVIVNNSGGAIATGKFINRLPFISDEKATNPAGVATGIQALGGADNQATPVWWAGAGQ